MVPRADRQRCCLVFELAGRWIATISFFQQQYTYHASFSPSSRLYAQRASFACPLRILPFDKETTDETAVLIPRKDVVVKWNAVCVAAAVTVVDVATVDAATAAANQPSRKQTLLPTRNAANRMKCPETTVEQAWHALSDGLRTFLRRRVPCDADADDLLQDLFVRVHEKIGSLRQSGRMESWVYQLARSAVADFYRRRVPRPSEAVEDVVDSIEDSETSENLNRSVSAWLLFMIDKLPNTVRDAVRMYEIDELPQAEIAKRLHISLSGAKSRVQRGRQQLKEMLRESCQLDIDRRGNVIACTPAQDVPCGQVACDCDQEETRQNATS